MKLKILLPTKILIDNEVEKVVAEGENGEFCLLPKHIDYITSLRSGILSFTANSVETFLAVDGGILLKKGPRSQYQHRARSSARTLGT